MAGRCDFPMTFFDFCQILEYVSLDETKPKSRREKIEKLFERIERNKGRHLPFLQLLAPELDTERSTYGLSDKTLGKAFVEIFGMPKTSDDAQKLQKWRDPSFSRSSAIANFSVTIFDITKRRGYDKASKISVHEINDMLTLLSTTEKAKKLDVLRPILLRFCALEHKWIARIILKDMKMHIGAKTILKIWHPDAEGMYNGCSDLRKVATEIEERGMSVVVKHSNDSQSGSALGSLISGDKTSSVTAQSITLGSAVRPMLASTLDAKKLTDLLRRPCILETKFDGERIMIHKMPSGEFAYFTRNAKDFTPHYGHKFDDAADSAILAKSCILDGEMLVWDDSIKSFLKFGSNRSLSSGSAAASHQFCYMCFDVIQVDGNDLTHFPLNKRQEILRKILSPQERSFEIVQGKPIRAAHEVSLELEIAIENGFEGVMVKAIDGTYQCGRRAESWAKQKPDYAGLRDTLDLIILGGYYGTKHQSRGVTHFLLGVAVSNKDGGHPEKFLPFCKVGSGYSAPELQHIQQKLDEHWCKYETSKQPAFWDRWDHKAADTPDVWIMPQNSILLEVLGASITESTTFKAGYTLRFPRVQRMRKDKDWHECMDFNTLVEMSRSTYRSKRKAEVLDLSSAASGGGDGGGKKGKSGGSAIGKRVTVLSHFADTDVSGVSVESDIFEGMHFVVLSTDEEVTTKSNLETLIVRNGGAKSANAIYGLTTHAIASAKRMGLRAQHIMQYGKGKEKDLDILHYSWILDSIKLGKKAPFQPRYFVHMSEATRAALSDVMDCYGDSYTEDTNEIQLKKMFESMIERGVTPAEEESIDLAQLDLELGFLPEETGNIFRYTDVYIDMFAVVGDESTECDHRLTNTQFWLQLFGAKISHEIHRNLTHVIVDDARTCRLSTILEMLESCGNDKAAVVDFNWVRASVEQQELVDPKDFSIKDF